MKRTLQFLLALLLMTGMANAQIKTTHIFEIVDFEDNFSFDSYWDNYCSFTNGEDYPWTVVENNGNHYIKSSNGGVSNSTSEITMRVVYTSTGTFSFDAECRGEGTSTAWDKCIFYIDGTEQFSYGATITDDGFLHYTYNITTTGAHLFKWVYSKDSSVNPNGDYMAIDNIKATKDVGVLDFEDGAQNIGTVAYPHEFYNSGFSYPWVVADVSSGCDNGSQYCLKSGNAGVSNSTSQIGSRICLEADGYIHFQAKCMGEGTNTFWDHCDFTIDDEVVFTHGADTSGWHYYTFWITGGEHYLYWSYTKDSSVNPTGDCFLIDNISFHGDTPISQINLEGFTEPVWGAHPDMELTVTGNNYSVSGSSYWYYINPATSDTNYMTSVDTFNNEDYIYYQRICVRPNGGYSFPADVAIFINGSTDIVASHTHLNLSGNIYEFVYTINYQVHAPTTYLSEIRINGFTEPTWGANPDCDVSVPTNAHYSITQNSWSWGDLMDATDVFDNEDYAYYQYFEITPDPGYAFDNNVAVYINNDQNIVRTYGWSNLGYEWVLTVDFHVTAPEPTMISEVYINGFTQPEWGAQPDLDLTVPAGANYYIDYTNWYYNDDEGSVSVTGTFNDPEAGYYQYIAIRPNSDNFLFTDDVTIYVNNDPNIISSHWISSKATVYVLEAATKEYYVTEPSSCVATTDINISYFTSNSVVLSWDGSAENYTVRYRVHNPDASVQTYGFEDGDPGWTLIDADGDEENWYYSNSTQNSSHSGTGIMTSASYIHGQGAVTPDNWLVLPQYTVHAGAAVSFWVAGQDPSWAAEHYAVYVSTTVDNDPSAFTAISDELVATGEWEQKTFDLSAYAGQSVYVAIRHFNITDMFRLNIDDVEIGTPEYGEWVVINGITDNHYTLTGLQAGTTYDVVVESSCSEVEEMFTTLPDGVNDMTESGINVWNRSGEIRVELDNDGHYTMNVVNILGQTVLTSNIDGMGSHIVRHNLTAGVYIVTLSNANSSFSTKIVVR